jgi:hypothetical protein
MNNLKNFVGEPIRVGNTSVLINPGTGPCGGATVDNAAENMEQFIKDCPCASRFEREEAGDYGDGRFCFQVFWDECPGKSWEVQMPGLPLDQVRYMGAEDQNIWNFPRLYVGGSSWVWKYALLKRYDWFSEEED